MKCLYEWSYTGKAHDDKDLVTCPKCHYRSMLKKVLDRIKDTPLTTHSLTHSLTHSKEKEQIQKNQYKRIVEVPKTESFERNPYANPILIKDKLGKVWKFPELLK